MVRVVTGRIAWVLVAAVVAAAGMAAGPRMLDEPVPYSSDGQLWVAAQRAELALDDPLGPATFERTAELLRGDLGRSWVNVLPVSDALGQRLPRTIGASALGVLLTLAIGVPVGVFLGSRRRRWPMTAWLAVVAVPPMLVFELLGRALGPGPDGPPPVVATTAVAVCVAAVLAPVVALLTARRLCVERAQPWVIGQIATGRPRRTRWREGPVRVCLLDALSHVRWLLPTAVSIVLLVDWRFAMNGVGKYLLDGIFKRDLPPTVGAMFVVSVLVVAAVAAVDVLATAVDPRRRPTADRRLLMAGAAAVEARAA